VARLATRIAVMNHGTLGLLGAPFEVFARGAELQAMGLDVPAAVRLSDALREKGLDVPGEVYQMPALTRWLIGRFVKGGEGA